MANKKKEVYTPKPMTEGKKAVIQGLLDEYDIQTTDDIHEALKDILSVTIQSLLEAEMSSHLGYEKYERDDEPNYRNGTKPKTAKCKYGEFKVDVPQDRDCSFEPTIVKKRQKDISGIEEQVMALYAKGMTTTQISETVESLYGFEIQRPVFPSPQALLKALYMATFEITKRWTVPIKNWGRVPWRAINYVSEQAIRLIQNPLSHMHTG